MAITWETLNKIEDIFGHMQLLDCRSVQVYDPLQELRPYCVFVKGFASDRSATEAFINFPADRIRIWHMRIWNKRKKQVPHQNYVTEFSGHNIIRFGFTI